MNILKTREKCITEKEFLTSSLFAHVHNDSRLKGTLLSGNTFNNTTTFMRKNLEFILNNKTAMDMNRQPNLFTTLKKLQEKFKSLIDYEKDISDIVEGSFNTEDIATKIVKQLEGKGSVMFPGGWVGLEYLQESGHAMCYQFVKNQDGSITFLIYNTGSGLLNHATKFGSKDKFYPVMAYQIPKITSDKPDDSALDKKQELVHFISNLLDPMVLPKQRSIKDDFFDSETRILASQYSAERLYGEVFAKIKQLGGQKIDPSPFCKTTTQGQESGTCSMRVLMPLLRNELPEDVFQEILYEIKLQSLCDYFALYKSELMQEEVYSQFSRALEKFSRSTHKFMKAKSGFKLSAERAKENLEFIGRLQKEINKAANNTALTEWYSNSINDADKISQQPTDLNQHFSEGLQQFFSYNFYVESNKPWALEGSIVKGPKFQYELQFIPMMSKDKDKDIETLSNPIHYLRASHKAIIENHEANVNPEALINDIESFFLQFPISGSEAEDYWGKLDIKDALEAYRILQSITRIYARNCMQNTDIPFPQRIITYYTGLALASRMVDKAMIEDRSRMLGPSILASDSFNYFKNLSQNPYFVSYNRKYDNRITQILEFSCNIPEAKDARAVFDQTLYNTASSSLIKDLLEGLPKPLDNETEYSPRSAIYKIANGNLAKPKNDELDPILDKFDLSLEFEEFTKDCILACNGNLNTVTSYDGSNRDQRFKKVSVTIFNNEFKYSTGLNTKIVPANKTIIDSQQAIENMALHFLLQTCQEKPELIQKSGSNGLEIVLNRLLQKLNNENKQGIKPIKEELLKLFPYTRLEKTSQIVATLELFNNQMDALRDSDVQTLCLLNLFEPLVLETQLNLNPKIADTLVNFITKGLQYFSQKSKYEQPYFYFLKLAYYMERNFQASTKAKEIENSVKKINDMSDSIRLQIEDLENKLAKIKTPKETGGSARNLFNHYVRQLKEFYKIYLMRQNIRAMNKNLLTKYEITLILKAQLFLQWVPGAERKSDADKILEKQDPNIQREMDQAISILSPRLKTSFLAFGFSERTRLINELMKSLPELPIDVSDMKEWSGSFPIYKFISISKEEIEIDILKGRITRNNYEYKPIPSQFYTAQFEQYFGKNRRFAKIYFHDKDKVCEFEDEKGKYRVILDVKQKLHVQKWSKSGNDWYEMIKKSEFIDFNMRYLPAILLEKDKSIWYNEKQRRFLINDQNGKEIIAIEDYNIDKAIADISKKKLKASERLKQYREEINALGAGDLYQEIEENEIKAKEGKLSQEELKELKAKKQNLKRLEQKIFKMEILRYEFHTVEDKLQSQLENLEKEKEEGLEKKLQNDFRSTIIKLDQNGNPSDYRLVNVRSEKFKDPLCGLIASFEDPNFILYWRKPIDKIASVPSNRTASIQEPISFLEFPRYGLKFSAEKDSQNQWHFYQLPDKEYELISRRQESPIPGLLAHLELKKVGSADTTSRKIIVPKQQIILQSKSGSDYLWGRYKDLHATYYRTGLDISNTLEDHYVDNYLSQYWTPPEGMSAVLIDMVKPKLRRGEFYHNKIENYQWTQQQKYYQLSVDKRGRWVGQTPEEWLYLAYLSLGYRQPERAFEYLLKCKHAGGLAGTKEEIELIRKILTEIPMSLGRMDDKTIEEQAAMRNPETNAVRVLASFLLVEYQHMATKPIEFDNVIISNENDPNTIFKKMLDKKTQKFYQNDFPLELRNCLIYYNRSYGNIPEGLRLNTEQEYSLLSNLHKYQKETPLFGRLHRRWRELQLKNTEKEIVELKKKKEDKTNNFSPVDNKRLIILQDWKKRNKPYLSVKTEFGSSKRLIKPIDHPFFKSNFNMLLAPSGLQNQYKTLDKGAKIEYQDSTNIEDTIKNMVFGAPKTFKTSTEIKKSQEENIVQSLSLGLWMKDVDFLSRFKEMYELAMAPTNETNIIQKEALKKFIELHLQVEFDRLALQDRPKPKLKESLCILLAYVIRDPEKFPKVVDKITTLLPLIYQQSIELNKNNPLLFESNGQTLRVVKKRRAKPIIKTENYKAEIESKAEPINLQTTSIIPKKGTSLAQSLGLDDFDKAIKANVKMSSDFDLTKLKEIEELSKLTFPLIKSNQKQVKKLEQDQEQVQEHDQFLTREVTDFNREFQAGVLQNNLIQQRKKISMDYLANNLSDNKVLNELSKKLGALIMESQAKIKIEKQGILSLANKKILGKDLNKFLGRELAFEEKEGKEAKETMLLLAQRLGKQRSHLKFADLIRLYLINDKTEYRVKTLLSDSEIDELHHAVHKFLLDSSSLQQRERSRALLEKITYITSEHPDYEGYIVQLGEELSASRAFDADLHPELLLFEYAENILIKPGQAKIIEELLHKKPTGFTNKIIQLVMGGGKSKVLLPLLALKKANGSNLSLIEVPSALFKTNVADLQATTQKIFGRSGYPFEFSRETQWTAADFHHHYEKLLQIMRNRDYVISTVESIQSLELKYFELLNIEVIEPVNLKIEWQNKVFYLEKILKILKNNTDAILDEVDSTLASKHELNYTIGPSGQMPEMYLDTVVGIYNLFNKVTIGEQPKQVNLDVITANASRVDEVQWNLARIKLVQLLQNDLESPIIAIVQTLDENQKAHLSQYLLGDPKMLKRPEFIDEMSKESRNVISLIKGEITLLATTLNREQNVHYGLSHKPKQSGEKEIAIPYLGNNTPNEGSQFQNPYETINYTIQLHYGKMIPIDILREFIIDFISQAELERQNAYLTAQETIPEVNITSAGRKFKSITGKNLTEISLDDNQQLQELQQSFSKIAKIKHYCLVHYILNKIPNHPIVLRSDPQNHLSQLHSRQGVTGSPINARTLVPKMDFNTEDTLGTDGQVLSNIINKNSKMHLADSNEPLKILAELFARHKSPEKFSAIIDAGAIFKGIDNLTASQKISELLEQYNPNILFVLYFNSKNVLCAWSLTQQQSITIGSTDQKIISTRLGVELDHCFTYYDQLRSRGTDIKQPSVGCGLVTIGMDTTDVDLRQSAMRMRGLPEKQTVEFIVSKEVLDNHKEIQPTAWNAQKLIEIVADVRLKNISIDHYRSGLQKMHDIIRNQLKNLIFDQTFEGKTKKETREKTIQNKHKLFSAFREAFMAQSENEPESLFGSIESQQNVTDLLKNIARDKYQLWLRLLSQGGVVLSVAEQDHVKEQLQSIAEQTAKICVKEMTASNRLDMDSTVTVETQLETRKEKELEREQELEIQKKMQSSKIMPLPIKTWPQSLQLAEIQLPVDKKEKASAQWPAYFPAVVSLANTIKSPNITFDNSIYMSRNFSSTYVDQTNFFDKHQKPMQLFLLIEDPPPRGFQALIITQEEAATFIESIERMKIQSTSMTKINRKAWIMSPHENVIVGTDPIPQSPEYYRLLEQITYINGDCDTLQKMSGKYQWFSEKTQDKIHLLQTTIMPLHQEKQKFFPGLKEKLTQQGLISEEIVNGNLYSANLTNKDLTSKDKPPITLYKESKGVRKQSGKMDTPEVSSSKPLPRFKPDKPE